MSIDSLSIDFFLCPKQKGVHPYGRKTKQQRTVETNNRQH
mgnify:CR=1 FL=1